MIMLTNLVRNGVKFSVSLAGRSGTTDVIVVVFG